MAERTYTAKLKDKDVTINSSDLHKFRDSYIRTSELSNRMSELIWFDIYVLDAIFDVTPHDVLRAIYDVEQGEPPSGVKAATQFRNMPLKGLWHKHYFAAPFLVKNIILALGKGGVEKIVKEVMDPAKSATVTREMINELAHRVTHEPAEMRDANKNLTGEWIVYIRHKEENYYLCCNTHDAGDQFIYDRIKKHCVRDFPDLLTWFKASQA